MTVLTYAYPDFTAYTKIVSAEVNSKFTSIATVLNGTAVLPRAILANGTANHVIINSGTGAPSSEAQLAKSRGGTGYDLTTQPLELPSIATPSTPSSGLGRIYFKSDGSLYQLNDAGTESKVGSGSGGGTNYISNPDAESAITGWNTYSSSVTATITIASPAVITVASTSGYNVGDPVVFTTTGALPTGLTSGTTYYISSVVSGTTYKVSATLGGSDVNTSGTQSGTHSAGLARPISGSGGTATATWTRSTASPLRGTANFLFTAGKTGDGVSFDMTIDRADQGRILNISFDYNLSATIADGDYSVWIYDITNASKIQPAPFRLSNISSSLNGKFTGTFQTATNSTSYRLCIHQSNVSTANVKVDNVVVGPQLVEYGAPVTDWQSYALVITGSSSNPSKGTVVTDNAQWRRVGDSMEIMWHYEQSSAGASAGSGTYLLSLPSGYSIDTTKTLVDTAGQRAVIGQGFLEANNGASNVLVGVFAYDSTHLAALNGPDGLTTPWGSTYYALNGANTSKYSIQARIPIAGWGSSVVMSNDTDTRVVAAFLSGDPASASSGNPIIFPTTTYDTHGAYNSVTGKYQAPVNGYYRIHGYLSTGAANTIISAYVNGVSRAAIGVTHANSTGLFDGTVKANAGDLINIAPSGTCDADSTSSMFIERISGPASIAASEKVVAAYTSTSGQTLASSANVNFETKLVDTHGTVTTGTSWRWTSPSAMNVRVDGNVQFGSGTPTNFSISVYKNGSVTAINGSLVSAQFGVSVFSGILPVVAGDYLEFKTNNSAGLAINTGGVQVNISSI